MRKAALIDHEWLTLISVHDRVSLEVAPMSSQYAFLPFYILSPLISIIPCFSVHAQSSEQSVSYGIAQFDNVDLACCPSCSLLPWADDRAIAWDNIVSGWASWNDSEHYIGTAVHGSYFEDASLGGCDDAIDVGADWGDISFLETHGACLIPEGSDYCGNTNGSDPLSLYVMKWRTDGYYGSCRPNTRDHVWLGDEDNTEFFAYACHSAQYEVWDFDFQTGYDSICVDGSYFGMYAGIHGLSWDHPVGTEMQTYMNGAYNNGAAEDWVDIFTDVYYGHQQCATVVVFAEDPDDYYIEAGLRNWLSPEIGDNSGGGVFYGVDGCEPDAGGDELDL